LYIVQRWVLNCFVHSTVMVLCYPVQFTVARTGLHCTAFRDWYRTALYSLQRFVPDCSVHTVYPFWVAGYSVQNTVVGIKLLCTGYSGSTILLCTVYSDGYYTTLYCVQWLVQDCSVQRRAVDRLLCAVYSTVLNTRMLCTVAGKRLQSCRKRKDGTGSR
jgi:hypothetical protein